MPLTERMADCRHLAFTSSIEEWNSRIHKSIDTEEFKSLNFKDVDFLFHWWQKNVRYDGTLLDTLFKFDHGQLRMANIDRTNPFVIVEIFSRLADVIDRKQVAISKIELAETRGVKHLSSSLQKNNITVGIFDASNMHNPEFLGVDLLQRILFGLPTQAKSILMTTNLFGNYAAATRETLERNDGTAAAAREYLQSPRKVESDANPNQRARLFEAPDCTNTLSNLRKITP